MIRETTADIIRRKRGMPVPEAPPDPSLMEQPGYGMEQNQGLPPRILEVPQAQPEDVEQAAQMLQEQEQPRPGSIPAQVGQSVMSAAPPLEDNRDQDELMAAQNTDRQARNSARMELATRQFVGGMTQTPVGQGIGAAPSQVPVAQANIRSRSERAAEALRQKRQGEQDDRQGRLDAEGREDRATSRSEKAAALLRAQKDKAEAEAESLRRFNVVDERQRDSNNAQLALSRTGLGLRIDDAGRDAAKFEADKAEKAKGKPLTDSTLMELADTDSAIASLGDLGKKFVSLGQEGLAAKASGKVSAALGLTSTDAGQFQSAAKLAMQGVGKIMEGGKLAAGDEVKYAAMLPVPGDSYESAATKVKAAQAYLRKLRDDRVAALKAAGRDVPSFGGPAKIADASMIRVRNKQTGQTGSIPAAKFNPDKYDKVQ